MRGAAIAVIVATSACSSPEKAAPPSTLDRDAAIAFASTHMRFADAAPDAAPPGAPARLAAYLQLLVQDLYVVELIQRFPGAPKGTVFDSLRYAWYTPTLIGVDPLVAWVDAAAKESGAVGQGGVADLAVRAYTEVAQRVLPAVVDLARYYERRRYVDDEFERGRREADRVAAAASALATVRAELWSRVLVEWREVAGDAPDSPRAIVSSAYEACMRGGVALATTGKGDAVNEAVSACRRGVAPVAALPPEIRHDFDHALRNAAVALGDIAARGPSLYEGPRSIADLTAAYLALWPLLPQAPAERTHP